MENKITLEDFDNYHNEVGEDFCDQNSHIIDHKILGGYIIAKFPEMASDILKSLNNKYCDANELRNTFSEFLGSDNDDEFYTLFAEFINLTTYLKANVQKIFNGETDE